MADRAHASTVRRVMGGAHAGSGVASTWPAPGAGRAFGSAAAMASLTFMATEAMSLTEDLMIDLISSQDSLTRCESSS